MLWCFGGTLVIRKMGRSDWSCPWSGIESSDEHRNFLHAVSWHTGSHFTVLLVAALGDSGMFYLFHLLSISWVADWPNLARHWKVKGCLTGWNSCRKKNQTSQFLTKRLCSPHDTHSDCAWRTNSNRDRRDASAFSQTSCLPEAWVG